MLLVTALLSSASAATQDQMTRVRTLLEKRPGVGCKGDGVTYSPTLSGQTVVVIIFDDIPSDNTPTGRIMWDEEADGTIDFGSWNDIFVAEKFGLAGTGGYDSGKSHGTERRPENQLYWQKEFDTFVTAYLFCLS